MASRFIRVHGQAGFTRKWLFDLRYTRHVPESNVLPVVAVLRFAYNFLPFCRPPSSSFHHGSVLLIHRKDTHISTSMFPFESHVSRDPLISQTLNEKRVRTLSRRLYILYLITVHFRAQLVCILYFHNAGIFKSARRDAISREIFSIPRIFFAIFDLIFSICQIHRLTLGYILPRRNQRSVI